jgi:hypothetical protein
MTKCWRTAEGAPVDQLADSWREDIHPAESRQVVVMAFVIDGALKFEHGPIVGWLWGQGGMPITVMMVDRDMESFAFAVQREDGRVEMVAINRQGFGMLKVYAREETWRKAMARKWRTEPRPLHMTLARPTIPAHN